METQVLSGFRRYFLGYATSLLGTAMAGPATVFAFLDTGRGADGLGLVLAAGIVPILLCLPVAGVVADRFGCRRAILFADGMRCLNRAAFACTLLLCTGRRRGYSCSSSACRTRATGCSSPAYSALIPGSWTRCPGLGQRADERGQVHGVGHRAVVVGRVVAAFGPALVLGLDSASYAVSFVALSGFRSRCPPTPPASRWFSPRPARGLVGVRLAPLVLDADAAVRAVQLPRLGTVPRPRADAIRTALRRRAGVGRGLGLQRARRGDRRQRPDTRPETPAAAAHQHQRPPRRTRWHRERSR